MGRPILFSGKKLTGEETVPYIGSQWVFSGDIVINQMCIILNISNFSFFNSLFVTIPYILHASNLSN